MQYPMTGNEESFSLGKNSNPSSDRLRFVRSKAGWIFGVCQGLSDRFDWPVLAVRMIWVLSIFCFGTGLLVYLLLGISLPREDREDRALDPQFLGVCSRLARRTKVEVGLVRFLTLLAIITSFGFAVMVYIILHFALETDRVIISK